MNRAYNTQYTYGHKFTWPITKVCIFVYSNGIRAQLHKYKKCGISNNIVGKYFLFLTVKQWKQYWFGPLVSVRITALKKPTRPISSRYNQELLVTTEFA